MRRLLVNDVLTCIPGTRTFWSDLQDWFDMNFLGGPYEQLAVLSEIALKSPTSVVIRNASYFGPIKTDVPQIALLQDVFADGPARQMQQEVLDSCLVVVANSTFTASHYQVKRAVDSRWMGPSKINIIPLPVDFSLFEPGNAMGLQQALSLPDDCIC